MPTAIPESNRADRWIWLSAMLVGLLLCLRWMEATVIQGHLIPLGHDSFLHGARIIEQLATGTLLEYDPRSYYPDGLWINWPWYYDAALTGIAWLGAQLGLPAIQATFVVPPAMFVVNLSILLAIVRELGLSAAARLLALGGFATAYFVQLLHAYGRIDHHHTELAFVLASLWLGLWLQREPGRIGLWVAWGLVLAGGQMIHPAMFILQIPAGLLLAWQWYAGEAPDRRAMTGYSAALFFGTLLILLGVSTMELGPFLYYQLSWFHLVVAALSSGFALLVALTGFRWWKVAAVAGVTAGVIGLLYAEITAGLSWLTAEMFATEYIGEMLSVPDILFGTGFNEVLRRFGLWPLLAIGGLLAISWPILRDGGWTHRFALIFCLFGVVLWITQIRLVYYAVPGLLLPGALALDRWQRPPTPARWGGVVLALVVSLGLTRDHSLGKIEPGWSWFIGLTQRVYPVMAEACRQRPGVVFSAPNYGHILRYFSDCSVLANNLIINNDHAETTQFVWRTLSSPMTELEAEFDWLDYVIVDSFSNMDVLFPDVPAGARAHEVLLDPDLESWPGLRLLVTFHGRNDQGEAVPMVRIFVVEKEGKAGGESSSAL